MKKLTVYIAAAIVVMLMAACSTTPKNTTEPENSNGQPDNLANPAAVYCMNLGYTLESVERNGGEDADCVFPDGSRCAQWDFLAGRCGQEHSFCEGQGGVLEEGGNIGVCRFPDGSVCDEYSFHSGECAPGDNPVETSGYPIEDNETMSEEPVNDDSTNGYPVEESDEQEVIDIQNFEEARDYMAIYFKNEYGVEAQEAWTEEDLTTENVTASRTYRYVSGPLTLVISSMASAPAVNYTIEEASDVTTGFYWQGTLQSDGTVIVDEVSPPASVLNVEDARDAALAYLTQNYEMTLNDDWTDEGSAEKPKTDKAEIVNTFTADSWTVEVEYMAAAPLVGQYLVRVMNQAGDFTWEGEITMYGEITEKSSSR
jgi:putative hemolysin